MTNNPTYRPIDCKHYDLLILWSTQSLPCDISLREESMLPIKEYHGVITDVFTKEKVEYLSLNHETTIRLDDIQGINGHEFGKTCSI